MAVLNIICNLSIHRINSFVLPMLKAILRARIPEVDVPRNFGDVADGFPDTIQAVISQLSLEPKTSTFVCCKECFSCYDPQDSPDTCTFKDASDSPLCGTPLFTERRRKGQTLREPVREIHFQDFEDWLARLLSRPGMEEILDRDVYQTGAGIGELFDIWDGEVLRNFQGPDGSNFFTCKGPGNLRLVFAICMDNFNPFFNKHGGKHYSAGVICLICLNLPPGMRHLIENIFIYCVVPGPREVELEKINHVQRRLIDTFLKFWQPGVYYSNTPRYPQGRLVNAAIVPLLGDFLAAKKLSGINRWCTQCTLPAISAENLDISTWPTRMTSEEHRRLAEEWKALGVRERNKHFRNHCIRWSELLRLPYWKPVEYTLVEFSHNLLTNNAERHLRTLLGMNVSLPDGMGDTEPPNPKPRRTASPLAVKLAWEKVLHGTDQQLAVLPAMVLKECCYEAKVPTGGHKMALLEALREWVRALSFPSCILKLISVSSAGPMVFLTKMDLRRNPCNAQMQAMTRESWRSSQARISYPTRLQRRISKR